MLLNIGNTPIVRLKSDERIFVKLEYLNPMGSVKDRAALFMIKYAMEQGKVKPYGHIVEATSGNTGIGLAYVGNIFKIHCTVVMPDFISEEKISLLKTLGAEVVLTDGASGMKGALLKARDIAETQNAFMINQFSNPANALAHKLGTGPEILRQMSLNVDAFVAGVGTGGTLMGTAAALKEFNDKVRIFAVEPAESDVLSGGKRGKHTIEGIGAGFVPPLYDERFVSDVIRVSEVDAWREAKRAAAIDAVCGGPSTGANIYAAKVVADKFSLRYVVTVAPDSCMRYGKELTS